MFFPASAKQEWFSKKCLLLAFFFTFSFNHIVFTKYHFLLGQASFYFIALALLTSNFRIPRKSLIFISIFLAYCLSSAGFFCIIGQGLCTTRPYTASINIIFVFLAVQYVAFLVQNNLGFEFAIEKYLICSAWALVFFAIPDLLILARGGVLEPVQYGFDFLSPFSLTQPSPNRLRGFTQEPSYLGVVISTLYPICFIRLNQRVTALRLLLVVGLWVCLAFSLSRTGLLSCFAMTFLVLFIWPKRLLLGILTLGFAVLMWVSFPQLYMGSFLSFKWLPLFNQANLDGSSLVRVAHIVASLKVWLATPFFGVGLGQAGYVIPQYYPSWYTPDSPEYTLWAPKASFGGVPSLSFLPKLLAEIGLFGLFILIYGLFSSLRKGVDLLKQNLELNKFAFAFMGFLLASFGVEGYLFLPAWLIFGVILGLCRSSLLGYKI